MVCNKIEDKNFVNNGAPTAQRGAWDGEEHEETNKNKQRNEKRKIGKCFDDSIQQ